MTKQMTLNINALGLFTEIHGKSISFLVPRTSLTGLIDRSSTPTHY